jgi:hypothetical protein
MKNWRPFGQVFLGRQMIAETVSCIRAKSVLRVIDIFKKEYTRISYLISKILGGKRVT